jgi:serine/threonine protein kinase/tetratricopeptide (TPR) repeat protein
VEPTLQDQIAEALSGSYVIERELGGGGMSRLFLARDLVLERQVAIKVLPPEFAAGVGTERFKREIVLAAQLQHANIVPLLTAGEAAGHPYFIMPYIEGESLRSRVARGPLSVTETTSVLRDVSRALSYAHERGVIHRDIKPDNVLVAGGAAMVSDFGVAKALSSAARSGPSATLTYVGTSLGTPSYMAPEQVAADPATDHRADLYALGIMGYELLTGFTPFHSRTPQATLTAHLTEIPRPLRELRPDVPGSLAAVIERCLEKDPERRPQTAAQVTTAVETPSGSTMIVPGAVSRRRPVVAFGVPVLIALAVLAAFFIFRSASSSALPSVAVLPMVNLGGDDEYFADGITDELTTALSQVSGLKVASRTSAFVFKGRRDVDARQIGDQLAVTHLVEGTVRKEGAQLRVSARLTSTEDGLTVWSSSYQREISDVFAVQEELARAIASALELQLSNQALVSRGTSDLEAYDLYLRGRFFWRQRGADGLRKATELFQQATQRDSNFAAAYTGLADALGLLPLYGSTPFDSVIGVARAAAERAIRLDSTLAEAHAALGQLLRNTGGWAESEEHLRRAIALDSTYAPAYQWLGEVLYLNGRLDEALEALRTGHRMDPVSPIIAMVASYVYGIKGDTIRSDSLARRAIELTPDAWPVHAFIGAGALESGRVGRAVAALERADSLAPSLPSPFRGLLAFSYARRGERSKATAILDQLLGETPQSPTSLAEVYAGLGDRERALDMLERALREREPFLYAASISPRWYASLRSDPRFAAIAEALKLDPRSFPGQNQP